METAIVDVTTHRTTAGLPLLYLTMFVIIFVGVRLLVTLTTIIQNIFGFFCAWNSIIRLNRSTPFKSSIVPSIYHQHNKKPLDEKELSDNDDCCPICLEQYVEGDVICHTSVCSHTFHLDCLHQCIRRQPFCPCCRKCMLQIDTDSHKMKNESNSTTNGLIQIFKYLKDFFCINSSSSQ